jgi:hypothetical protein
LQLIKYLRVFPTTRVASTHQLSAHYQHSLVRSHDTIHVRCGCSSTKEYQRHPQFAQLQQFPQFIQLPQFARSKEQHHVAQPGWRHAARRSRGRPQASHLPTVHAATLIHRHATAIYTAAIIPRHATPLRACSEHSLRPYVNHQTPRRPVPRPARRSRRRRCRDSWRSIRRSKCFFILCFVMVVVGFMIISTALLCGRSTAEKAKKAAQEQEQAKAQSVWRLR